MVSLIFEVDGYMLYFLKNDFNLIIFNLELNVFLLNIFL